MNQFELYRNDNVPFNIKNKEMWALLDRVEHKNIAHLRKEFKNLSLAELSENREQMLHWNATDEEDFYVAANMQFIEDAYFFLKCEHCGKILDFYVVSV